MRRGKDELLFNIIVPKEIFKAETGELKAWIYKHYLPVEITAKYNILLVDLHARFTIEKLIASSVSLRCG